MTDLLTVALALSTGLLAGAIVGYVLACRAIAKQMAVLRERAEERAYSEAMEEHR